MLFHYGNCKKQIQDLENQLLAAINQVREGQALYDYQVGIQEIQIKELNTENSFRRDQMIQYEKDLAECHRIDQARLCLMDSLEKERAHLNQLISRKDDEIKTLKQEFERRVEEQRMQDRREADQPTAFTVVMEKPEIRPYKKKKK
jgi:hypothetical protein